MTDTQATDLTGKTAQDMIRALDLAPHPEGGHYRQTWIAEGPGRPAGTCIYFLLGAGESSHWHRVDAAEIWHYYAGAPLILSLSDSGTGPAQDHVLGPDLFAGQTPQIIVPPHHWQAAATTSNWTLVGCTVSPAFQFEGFELAPPGFDIPRAD
jgi:predicted cupin superfamily sugar epimerase